MQPNPTRLIARRARTVGIIKFVIASIFAVVVLINLRHPATLAVTVIDLLLVPVFVWLAPRKPTWAAYGMVLSTALLLTPRQFVQGYVNGINWVLYIAVPLMGGYILNTRKALWVSTGITAVIAIPVMVYAAFTLPARVTATEIFTLLVFVVGVLMGVVLVFGAALREGE